ncbi:MAG: hypothetical protein HOE30_04950 [Deltaproteobacteria bacterium]|jgi:hypothetical protein|nr:hypothetical protein [Deltaproteobacteria bacterium]MBT4264194.1 hypothetical protein [Deltaproteobacteria bacterium]MBT4641320.1 hypothetical protein [Deltaproteobacteria bacterium]MBT6502192.1 hypothetical protein [Deltaproteobacteria bacterium]MBT7155578.1 hypothetical protein [Deltaproteobacteria bacterium]
MWVIALNPGCNLEDVLENCGFELLQTDEIQQTKPTTAQELRILSEEVDPNRYVNERCESITEADDLSVSEFRTSQARI